MDLGEHAGFIIGGYLASFVVIVGLIVFSVNRSRRVRAKLDELEASGIRRRSDARPAGAALADGELEEAGRAARKVNQVKALPRETKA